MESLDKINLDVNTMLINWGLILGRYQDGVMRTTKFGIMNMGFTFALFLFEAIKWMTLIFYDEDSKLAIYLGEFAQYFGPKLVCDFIAAAEPVNSVIIISIFYLLSNKMHFWLDHMEFDSESRSFKKLNLIVSDSKRFTKQFALLWLIIDKANYFLVSITFCAMFGSFLIFKNEYHLYYFISVFLFSVGVWYLGCHWFGLTLLLYQVN